jgi:hypothetical protein
VLDLVHALADPDRRRKVIDHLDAVEGAAEDWRVADVAADQLDVAVQIRRPIAVLAVHLRREQVECPHPVTAREQLVGQMRADESGPAGDENVHDSDSPRLTPPRGARLAYAAASA